MPPRSQQRAPSTDWTVSKRLNRVPGDPVAVGFWIVSKNGAIEQFCLRKNAAVQFARAHSMREGVPYWVEQGGKFVEARPQHGLRPPSAEARRALRASKP